MGSDDSLYLTTYEAALAVVATSMKKARLRIDTLIINSIMGGIFFTSGGMLHVMAQSLCPEIYKSDPGIIQLIQGLVYPIGLFYVVIMGVDLFNSNVLFFSVGVCRGAVSILDLIISWFVSWWFNLAGNIFVCYIFCHYSEVTSTSLMIEGSVAILVSKAEHSFVQTLLRAMAGNFFVCLAIYLQLMAKPLHVKFLMMLLPVFTFVAMGFTHSVADMFMLVIGLINKAPVPFATVVWKVFLPGAIGNMIGGSFFGIVIPWYLHLVVVERDQRLLNLPKYDVRDEQPELNQDSRVVRQKVPEEDDIVEEYPDDYLPEKEKSENSQEISSGGSMSAEMANEPPPQALYEPSLHENLSRVPTLSSRATGMSRSSAASIRQRHKSPQNVFPVYGMGPPSERERSIASGKSSKNLNDNASVYTAGSEFDVEPAKSAEYIGTQIRRALSRRQSSNKTDLEQQRSPSIENRPSLFKARTVSSRQAPFKNFSFSNYSTKSKNNLSDLNERMDRAGINNVAAQASNEAAGISPFSMTQKRKSIPKQSSPERPIPTQIEEESLSKSESKDADGDSSFKIALYNPEDGERKD